MKYHSFWQFLLLCILWGQKCPKLTFSHHRPWAGGDSISRSPSLSLSLCNSTNLLNSDSDQVRPTGAGWPHVGPLGELRGQLEGTFLGVFLWVFLGCFGVFLRCFWGCFLGILGGVFADIFGGDMEVLWHLYHLKKLTRHAGGEVSHIAKFFYKFSLYP